MSTRVVKHQINLQLNPVNLIDSITSKKETQSEMGLNTMFGEILAQLIDSRFSEIQQKQNKLPLIIGNRELPKKEYGGMRKG